MANNIKPIPLQDIEQVYNEVFDKGYKILYDRLWQMLEQNLKYQFTIKACKWLRLHMPFGEVDKEFRDNIIDEFEDFMKK